MSSLPPPPAISFETALAALSALMPPARVRLLPIEEAKGRISAGESLSLQPLPAQTTALYDGYACRALDLVGASVFAPAYLPQSPDWVGAGAALPAGCDGVLPAALFEARGPSALALGEIFPGEGIWTKGAWLGTGQALPPRGQRIGPLDQLLAREAGLAQIACLIPKLRLIDISEGPEIGPTTRLLADWLIRQGVDLSLGCSQGREASAILTALTAEAADLTLLVGGTGEGPDDHCHSALALAGAVLSRGAGLNATPSLLLADVGQRPVIALPGSLEGALTAALAVIVPLLAQAFGQPAPLALTLPALGKVSSPVGLAEVLLLARRAEGWLPLNSGLPTPLALRQAEAFALLPSGDEGHALGAPISAQLLQNWAFA